MPEEFSRTTARKRITLPGGAGQVDVPVITKISFVDGSDRAQETQHDIDNSAASAREVHVDSVSNTFGTGEGLLVERIDVWKTIDAADRYQETELTLDNVTGADATPPHFSTHLATHVIRYKNNPDDGAWIDSELIDEIVVIGERGQETHYYLNNPAADDPAGQADPNDPEISDSSNGIDPPWRTDPFQNIIAWNGSVSTASPVEYSISMTVSINPTDKNLLEAVTTSTGSPDPQHFAFLYNTQMNGRTWGDVTWTPTQISIADSSPGPTYDPFMSSISVSGNNFVVTIGWQNTVTPFDQQAGGTYNVPSGPFTFTQIAKTSFEVSQNYQFAFPFQGPDGIGVATGVWSSGNLKPTTFDPAAGLTHTAIEMFPTTA